MAFTGKNHFARTPGTGNEYVSTAYHWLEPMGNIFYVHSVTGANAADNGRSPEDPVATLDYAIGLCTANNNDVIVILPNHAENVGSAGAITCDVAGVRIIGVGEGSYRPTFTWSNTAGTIAISAANVTIENIITKVSVDEVVSMFNVTGAGVTLDRVDFVETASAQAIQWLLTTAAADHLTIKNCHHAQVNAAGIAQKWIELVGVDFARIVDNVFFIVGNASTSSHLISGSTAVVYCEIARNIMWFSGATIDKVVNLVTTSTGFIHDNRAFSGTSVTTAGAYTCDACAFAENYWADSAAASGLLAPVVDTDS